MSFIQLRSAFFDNDARPLLTTSAATSIGSTSADGNGNVITDRGSTITERGFCWSTSTPPTTADNKVIVAGTTGIFTGSMTGLSASTTYYYRSYAINDFGTGYGDIWVFTTTAVGEATTYAPTWMMMGIGY